MAAATCPSGALLLGHVLVLACSEIDEAVPPGTVCELEQAAQSEGRASAKAFVFRAAKPLGTTLHEVPSVATVGTSHAIATSLHFLRQANSCRLAVCVLSRRERAHVLRVDVWLRTEVLEGLVPWKPSKHVGELFARLVPARPETAASPCACPLCVGAAAAATAPCAACGGAAPGAGAGAERALETLTPRDPAAPAGPFQLKDCILQLPNWVLETPALPAPPPARAAGGAAPCLAALSEDVLRRVLARCTDVAAVACTCRRLAAVAEEAVPELGLTLHPHQCAGLRRMLERERPSPPLRHPHTRLVPLQPAASLVAALNCATGGVTLEAPAPVADVRGGFYCDEPGLGKTVTSIALILKTAGAVPAAPAGAAVCEGSVVVATGGVRRELTGWEYVPSAAPDDAGDAGDGHSACQDGVACGASPVAAPPGVVRDGPGSLSGRVKRRRAAAAAATAPPPPPWPPEQDQDGDTLEAALRRRVRAAVPDGDRGSRAVVTSGADPRHAPPPLPAVPLSGATLVVVPSTLIKHWAEQIVRHTAAGALRVYAVLDRATADIDPRALAWDYDVVLTTFTLLSSLTTAAGPVPSSAVVPSSHVLFRVHWLRVFLDEGHLLGTAAVTNRLRATCALKAERRWVLTGTPTPTSPGAPVTALQPLLAYLGHEPYGRSVLAFDAAIKAPFEAGRPLGRARLMDVLARTMIRASKADVQGRLLQPCTKSVVRLPFDAEHQACYNVLIELVLRNLLLADWFDEDHSESFLNQRRSKRSRELLQNVRKACCVAGQFHIEAKEEDILETMELLCERHGHAAPRPRGAQLADAPLTPPTHPLHHVEAAMRGGGACEACGVRVRLVIVTPCAHVVCASCASSDGTACVVPGCEHRYAMQAVDEPARRKYNQNPKWPVPVELIEWQASVHQRGAQGQSGGTWQATWEVTNSSKCRYLLRRLGELGLVPEAPENEQIAGDAGFASAEQPAAGDAADALHAASSGEAFLGAAVLGEGASGTACAPVADSGSPCSLHGPLQPAPCSGSSHSEPANGVTVARDMSRCDCEGASEHSTPAGSSAAAAGVPEAASCSKRAAPCGDGGERPRWQWPEGAPQRQRKRVRFAERLVIEQAPPPLRNSAVSREGVVCPATLLAPSKAGAAAAQPPSEARPVAGCAPPGCVAASGCRGPGGACAPAGLPDSATASAALTVAELKGAVAARPSGSAQVAAGAPCATPPRGTAGGHAAGGVKRRIPESSGATDSSRPDSGAETPSQAGTEPPLRVRRPAAASSSDDEVRFERAGPAGFAANVAPAASGVSRAGGADTACGPQPLCDHADAAAGARGASEALNSNVGVGPAVGAARPVLRSALKPPTQRKSFPEPEDVDALASAPAASAAPLLARSPQRRRPRQGARGAKVVDESAAAALNGLSAGVSAGRRVPAAGGAAPPPRRCKVIVHSSFWEHLALVRQQLTRAGVVFEDLRGNSTPRAKSAALHRFEHDAACCVLVMDDSGAVGLDLSFVEVVFLMEPLVDTAQEQQIVSRAHRMGATAPVRVEVLVMQGTAEDNIVQMQRAQQAAHSSSGGAAQRGGDAAAASAAASAMMAHGGNANAAAASGTKAPAATRRSHCLESCWKQVLSWSKEGEVKKRSARNVVLLSLQHVEHTDVQETVHTVRIA